MRRLGAIFALALLVSSSSPAASAPAAGDAAPPFKLRAPDGALIRLDEMAYPGKEKSWAHKRPVLIDFFRTDCSPCRRAIPELVEVHKTYGDRGLEVVLIALLEETDGRAKLDAYLAKQSLPFKVAIDETEHFAKKYLGNTVKIPATFLIDENGVVRKVKHGGKGSMMKSFGASIEAVLPPTQGPSASKQPAQEAPQPAARTIGGTP